MAFLQARSRKPRALKTLLEVTAPRFSHAILAPDRVTGLKGIISRAVMQTLRTLLGRDRRSGDGRGVLAISSRSLIKS
jgi:hypothetical protein